MEWLNYHHLLYFWVVAREGSLSRASEKLRLAHPTVSGQIRALEEALGEKLFARSGRKLVLTEMGRTVYRYADEIFSLGRELMDTVKGRPVGRPLRLVVGIADVLPKLIAKRLIDPALRLPQELRLICHEDRTDRLLAEMALHSIDVILTDAPLPPGSAVRAYNHLLGECGVAFFGDAKLASALRRGFPRSLDGAPTLLPADNTTLRRSLDQWFEKNGVRPKIVGEFDDSALLKVFGQDGAGIFASPSILADAIKKQYQVQLIGRTDDIRERFYAVSAERRLKHPGVVAICAAAREELFR